MSLFKSLNWFCGKDEPDFGSDDQFLSGDHAPRECASVIEGTEIVLKEQTLEESKIKHYEPIASQKETLYEPNTLSGYIGQENAKDQVKTTIKIIKELRPIHILLNGWAGCGKTLLAKIISKMLGANFIYKVPEQLQNMDDLIAVINEIQEKKQLTVFMIDEIHTIDTKLVNVLLPILQEWKYGNKHIRPFVMIGATTDKDRLVKKQSPLVSRFQIQITLDKYTPIELTTIIKNYKDNMYPGFDINEKDLNIIAQNSRGVPREAIALLLKLLVINDINKVLKQSDIIADGLTKIDVKILVTLNESLKPMGANYLSQAVGIPQSDYEAIYERYLVEKGYIARTSRGRSIRDKGKELLNVLSHN